MPKEANERFSAQVARVLRAAGWHEGRDIGARAEEMLTVSVERARAEGVALEAFPAVRAALHEFGGLTVAAEAVGPFNGKDFAIDASVQMRGYGGYGHLRHIVRGRVFPLGIEFSEHSMLMMAENGEVYLQHAPTGTYYVGASMDAALDTLIDMKAVLPDLWEYYELDVVEESGWRFNERTTAILLGGGWTVGRDLGARADELIARAVEEAGALGHELEPFPAAVAAIREFGGLRFTKRELGDTTGFDGFDVVFDPCEVSMEPHRKLERVLGLRCFPLGRNLEYDFSLWIGTDGAVYYLFHDGTGIELVGATMDEAVSHWLQDYPLTEVPDSVDGPDSVKTPDSVERPDSVDGPGAPEG